MRPPTHIYKYIPSYRIIFWGGNRVGRKSYVANIVMYMLHTYIPRSQSVSLGSPVARNTTHVYRIQQ